MGDAGRRVQGDKEVWVYKVHDGPSKRFIFYHHHQLNFDLHIAKEQREIETESSESKAPHQVKMYLLKSMALGMLLSTAVTIAAPTDAATEVSTDGNAGI